MTFQAKKTFLVFTVLLLGVAVTSPAFAATTTCGVSASSIDFGSYRGSSANALDGVGTITVSCNQPPTGAVLVIGKGGSGTYYQRRMTAGTNILEYNLFTSAARTSVWGEGGASGTTVVPISGSGAYTVYGRVFGAQKVPVGSYSDVVVVTLTY
jgi:spore coat protein U-like protein